MALGGIVICIFMAGFFGGLEVGLLSANQLSLYARASRKILYARAAYFLLRKPSRLLSTTLIGTNIAVVAATVLLKGIFVELGLPAWSAWLSSLGLSIILLIFSEIIPKSFFRRHADTLSVRLAPLLVGFHFVFFPLSVLLNAIVNLLLLLMRQQQKPRGPRTREDLKFLIKLVSKEAAIPASGQGIFDDIFDFQHTLAREVMIPFHEIPVCSIDNSPEKLVSLYLKTKAQFIVIFAERADNIVGYINICDLVANQAETIARSMKKPVFYPDIKRIPDLLLAMNRQKLDAVFLSDEYGGISGMITPDEIAAEIIGYIPGDRKKQQKDLEKITNNHYIVSGTTDIKDLTNITGYPITRGYYDTIGGFLCDKLGIIPEPGVIFEEKGVLFKVLDRDERHIKRVEIIRNRKDESEAKINR